MTSNIINGAHALIGLATVGAFLIAFYWPWQAVWADIARQIVFEKRDAIFDIARAGGISFNSREYRYVRTSLEQVIRFAHLATLPRILLAAFTAWWRGELPTHSPIDDAIDRISNEEVRLAIKKLVAQALRAVAMTMAIRSLPVLVLFPLTLIAIGTLALCHNLARALARIVGIVILVESEANRGQRGPRIAAA